MNTVKTRLGSPIGPGLLLVLLWISFAIADPNAPCYFPGGEPAFLYRPCLANAFTSQCCPAGFSCFSGNICVLTDPNTTAINVPLGTSFRPACTNPLWNIRQCADYCLSENSSGELTTCGNNRYCCRDEELNGECDCESGFGTFSVEPGRVQTIVGVTTPSNFTTIPPVSRSSTLPSSTVATTEASTTPVSTSAETSSLSGPIETAAPANDDEVTDSVGFKVGIGIGCTVIGLLILGLLAFLLRRHQKAKQEPQPEVAPYPNLMRTGSEYSDAQPRTSNLSAYGPAHHPITALGSTYQRDNMRNYPGPLSSNPSASPYTSARVSSDVGMGVPEPYTHLRPVSEVTEPSTSNTNSGPSPVEERHSRSFYSGPSPLEDRNSQSFNTPYVTVDLVDDYDQPDRPRPPSTIAPSPVSPISSYRPPRSDWARG